MDGNEQLHHVSCYSNHVWILGYVALESRINVFIDSHERCSINSIWRVFVWCRVKWNNTILNILGTFFRRWLQFLLFRSTVAIIMTDWHYLVAGKLLVSVRPGTTPIPTSAPSIKVGRALRFWSALCLRATVAGDLKRWVALQLL